MSPTQAGLVCSASDYQHARPNIETKKQSSTSHKRSASEYSVLNNEHLYSRHSFFEHPTSEASYDPFRASREPSLRAKSNHIQVTIHRNSSSSGRHLKRSDTFRGSIRSSLRIEALRHRGSLRSSVLSSTGTSAKGSPGQRLSSSARRQKSVSHLTSGSSAKLQGSGISITRPSSRYKRVVNFEHRRRGSAAPSSTPRTSTDMPHRQPMQPGTRDLWDSPATPLTSEWPSSPPILPDHVVRSAKEKNLIYLATPRTRTLKHIEQEARQVSYELEKVCEEAFFRSSISDSVRTSSTGKPSPHSDTPPSSMSKSSPYPPEKTIRIDKAALLNRPLPPPPPVEAVQASKETPGTYTARELLNTRQRLAMRYAQDGANNQAVFNDILDQLDSLMPSESMQSGRRTASAPTPASNFEEPKYLQAIPEEGRFADTLDEHFSSIQDGSLRWNRAATDPIAAKSPKAMLRLSVW
jgi:serine/threonine-protein kinase HSL1 (negative regulator of Swe1 kinase)